MPQQKTLIFLLAITIFTALVGGIALATQSTGSADSTVSSTSSSSITSISSSNTINNSTGSSATSVSSRGNYIAYSSASLTQQKNVIFFAAAWCPSCQEFDRNLRATESQIPGNLTILKADFDTETSLRQKYGVTLQHTFVQVDAAGNLLKKWNGLYQINTLEGVLAEII